MSATQEPRTKPDQAADAADPFFYGWRDVWVRRDDGTEGFDQIPLTPETCSIPRRGTTSCTPTATTRTATT